MGGVMPMSRARLQTMGAIVIMVVCAAAVLAFTWQIHRVVLQVYALIALFIAFHAAPPVARWRAGVPVVHCAIFYSLLAAVVAGHFSMNKERYFPFVAWNIFSKVNEEQIVSCPELIGTTANGKSVRLLVEQLFPSIVQFDLPPPDKPDQMARLVTALAKAYNARHAADPVREVDLMLMAVKLHPPPGQSHSEPSCEFLHRYDISSAPSS
jgi:hypothetical protein